MTKYQVGVSAKVSYSQFWYVDVELEEDATEEEIRAKAIKEASTNNIYQYSTDYCSGSSEWKSHEIAEYDDNDEEEEQ